MSLSSVEGRRAAAVLEETIRKLTFLEAISPDILQHRDELTKFVGDEVSQIIGDQRLLEERYEGLISQRSKLRGVANKFRYKLVQTEIEGKFPCFASSKVSFGEERSLDDRVLLYPHAQRKWIIAWSRNHWLGKRGRRALCRGGQTHQTRQC